MQHAPPHLTIVRAHCGGSCMRKHVSLEISQLRSAPSSTPSPMRHLVGLYFCTPDAWSVLFGVSIPVSCPNIECLSDAALAVFCDAQSFTRCGSCGCSVCQVSMQSDRQCASLLLQSAWPLPSSSVLTTSCPGSGGDRRAHDQGRREEASVHDTPQCPRGPLRRRSLWGPFRGRARHGSRL